MIATDLGTYAGFHCKQTHLGTFTCEALRLSFKTLPELHAAIDALFPEEESEENEALTVLKKLEKDDPFLGAAHPVKKAISFLEKKARFKMTTQQTAEHPLSKAEGRA